MVRISVHDLRLMPWVQKEFENELHIWLVKVKDFVDCGSANSNCITVIVLLPLETVENFRVQMFSRDKHRPGLFRRLGQTS